MRTPVETVEDDDFVKTSCVFDATPHCRAQRPPSPAPSLRFLGGENTNWSSRLSSQILCTSSENKHTSQKMVMQITSVQQTLITPA